MIKILKRELTTFDLSENEYDDESISLSSSIMSADELEQDDKNRLDSSSTNISQIQQKKVILKNFILFIQTVSSNQSFQHFREHSSDSLLNNKSSTTDTELLRKNPYDFESDDDETTKDSKLQINTSTFNDNSDFQIEEQSTSDNEHIYRVPPLRIVLARAVVQNNER